MSDVDDDFMCEDEEDYGLVSHICTLLQAAVVLVTLGHIEVREGLMIYIIFSGIL